MYVCVLAQTVALTANGLVIPVHLLAVTIVSKVSLSATDALLKTQAVTENMFVCWCCRWNILTSYTNIINK